MQPLPLTPLRAFFNLPTEVKAVDFVHQIHGDADTIEKTLQLYQVTPSISTRLDAALDNVKRGLVERKSIFTWIHGSFGCGKSHFMNVLTLMLADEKSVYTIHPELQAHREKFPEAIGKKLFRLHVQCISRGATSVEDIVLGSAREELARLHPNVPPPAIFESKHIFASASRLLDDLGDAKFFGAFPSNQATTQDSDWGELAGTVWDRPKFEAAIAAPHTPEAHRLAGELAKTPWLEGVAASSGYVNLGLGLQILAAYLKALGYDGIVLFLDELVLWLSTFQDPVHLAREAPKVSTLVEHGNYPPVLPYITFAARQRDLSEMVGKLTVGADEVLFRDQLSFWKDRFETISLEDKDLPRIIEKRILQAKDAEATAKIDKAFLEYKATFAQDFRQLTGNQGDAEDFRRVYPLSPALVEVMVVLSATLQKDRTALRELSNLLVSYLPDFKLGNVVPVGDLFDVVVHGKASDLKAVQRVYDQARRIYENDLLPHIRKKQKTDNAERCQLKREEFDAKLGCSGCPESACRAQTRIAKTVLLQGLAPNTPVLKSLTASSLVYLNSGTLKSKIPNQETAQAAAFLREWATVTPAIHVKGETNPEVSALLDTVDVRRILDFCRDLDNQQRRRMRVRDILFEKMVVQRKEQMGTRNVEWRGRKWTVGLVYDNTRLANDNVFRPGIGEDLRVLVDYPFDDADHGPQDDEVAVKRVIDGLAQGPDGPRGLATLVWLPSFVDEDTQSALADLCILDGLIEFRDQDLASRLTFVSMEEIPKVRGTLEQQREHKRALVERTLESAYGLNHTHDSHLAPGRAPDRHVYMLRADAKLELQTGGSFDQALQSLLKNALEIRAPRHPVFTKTPTKPRLETVLELLEKLLETPDRKARFTRAEIDELRGIAAAEHLGLVRIIEEDVTYAGGILEDVSRNLVNHTSLGNSPNLSVGAVRKALDPDRLMDLSPEVEDFLILAYAKMALKPFRLRRAGVGDKSNDNKLVGRLTDDISLIPVEMPTASTWKAAVQNAGLLGVSFKGKAITPAQLDDLAQLAATAARQLGVEKIQQIRGLLAEMQAIAGIEESSEATQRGNVLLVLGELVQSVLDSFPEGRKTNATMVDASSSGSLAVVKALAAFKFDEARTTAIVAIAKQHVLDSMLDTLGSGILKSAIQAGHRLEQDPMWQVKATSVLSRVRKILVADENIEPIKRGLELESTHITQILARDESTLPPRPATQITDQTPLFDVGELRRVASTPTLKADAPVDGAPDNRVSGGVSASVSDGVSNDVQVILSQADVDGLAAKLSAHVAAGQHLEVTVHVRTGTRMAKDT